ncbi:uncharacterized protein LOC131294015 [Anopheles ziemanni]|uniref:uncharacterized protein LOC131262124 n=1 Tax=Anopheles coustani TaxID=139045 RepID=UPI002658A1F7|nr:uncharacterized protein LOC131262124 [Anopheles coustani]XP_058178046.1 uncharacterized protein LOC131294015 [Anopheles ziemanni]
MNSKCRLCLCSIGKQTEYSSTLTDQSFSDMIKKVFPFQLPTVQTMAGKSYNLPVLVCFQCSYTVRNFFGFVKLTEANQQKMQTECMDKDANEAIMELLQCMKADPDDEMETNDSNRHENPLLKISTNVAASKSTNRLNVDEMKTPVKQNNHPLVSASLGARVRSGQHPSAECLNQEVVVNYIKKMEKRVALVSNKMDMLLKSITSTRGVSRKSSGNSTISEVFEFSPIVAEEELMSFNKQLEEKEYFEKMLDWINNRVTAIESNNRMHELIDLIFTKPLFAKCSWTGRCKGGGKKIAFHTITNVLELFRCVGSTNVCTIGMTYVSRFIKKKLMHATERVVVSGLRKTSCHVTRLAKSGDLPL